jgi:hypothetical protein
VTKTAEDVRKELEKRKKKRGKRPWIGMEVGTTYIRVGPPWEKEGEIWKDVLFHGDFNNKVYCAQNDLDEKTGKPTPCIVCEAWNKYRKERTPVAKQLYTLLRQKSESIWNVLIAKVKKSDDGSIKVRGYEDDQFKLLRLSAKWHNLLLEIFSDEDYRKNSILGVADKRTGRLIRVKREGKGRDDTDYHFKAMEQETPISSDKEQREALIKTLNNLDEIVSGSSKEELETFVAKMKKKARRDAEDGSDDSDDSSEDSSSDSSDASDKSYASEKSDSSDSSDSSEDGSDDLEKQYKKLKKKMASKKKDSDDSSE